MSISTVPPKHDSETLFSILYRCPIHIKVIESFVILVNNPLLKTGKPEEQPSGEKRRKIRREIAKSREV